MDNQKLADLLRATIDPNQREAAEKHLEQIHKIIGFAPAILTLVMSNDLDMPIRQAGVIYLKNLISNSWEEVESRPGEPLKFNIHEQDRAMIRDAIVDAVVLAPDLVRIQLSMCVETIVRHDFPGRWSNIVDKVSIYLQSPDISGWMGALLCMHQLVKHYEFKEHSKRIPLNEALKLLLPLTYQRLVELLPNQSEQSVVLQKQILKIFHTYVEYFLCLDIVTQEVFHQWMQVAQEILKRPVPEVTNTIDEDERPTLVWWKCKKWAARFLYRVFQHYGSPGKVQEMYSKFADFYIKTYTASVIETMLGILDQQQKKIYVSPRVLQFTFNYLSEGVPHSIAWKLMKPHIIGIIQEVVYPLMCHTKQDEELWESDPYEYIRMKFDIFADYLSPVSAAHTLLHVVAKKRKDMLTKIMMSVQEVITNQHSSASQIDGALHITGAVADLLLKKETFKDQMEMMIMAHVVPLFESPHPYLRARACWMVQKFARTDFTEDSNLHLAVEKVIGCLIGNQDLPVKVEAAIAMKDLLKGQTKVKPLLAPHIQQIAMEILNILRESETDDLTTVMEIIVATYPEHLEPLAIRITEHLATTFNQLLESDDRADDKIVTGMGILATFKTVILEFEEQPDILVHVENIITNILKTIFSQCLLEFYDEAFDLICSLTCDRITPQMWAMFDVLYEVGRSSTNEYFLELMPSLHNFVTVDPNTFLSNEKNLLAVYDLSKTILSGNPGEDTECHAGKILEVILLQYKGKIDTCVPSFVDLALQRLMKPILSSELRVMCIQIVVAALYYNPTLLFQLLEKIPMPNTTETITAYFIKQWIQDVDCFAGIHDRKLCILGLCELLLLTSSNRHQAITSRAKEIIPALVILFDGIKLSYANKAMAENEENNEEYESDEDDPGLATDEDDLEDEDAAYLNKIIAKAKANSPFPVTAATVTNPENGEQQNDLRFLEDSDDEDYEDPLEIYTTPLDEDNCPVDEYISFKDTLQQIQSCDPNWYNAVTQHLDDEQKKTLNEIFILADQRRAAAESKRIEKSGGYTFQNQAVPSSFNFSSPR
ncbi:Importin-7 [Nymphon striatum]|nr:Importin-7 [Nymphon striatum]